VLSSRPNFILKEKRKQVNPVRKGWALGLYNEVKKERFKFFILSTAV